MDASKYRVGVYVVTGFPDPATAIESIRFPSRFMRRKEMYRPPSGLLPDSTVDITVSSINGKEVSMRFIFIEPRKRLSILYFTMPFGLKK